VQPQEPSTGQVPPPGVTPAGPVPAGRPVPQRSRARLVVALVGGILALLCVGGAGVFVALYDKATKIQRSAPDAVVDSFLRAYLVNRDDQEASLFECKSGPDLQAMAAFRSDVQGRETKYTISIQVSWNDLIVTTDAGRTTVRTDIFRAISDGSERTSDRWEFRMTDEDGWRVCGAKQVS
jgi:hypothetical protein